MTAISWEWLTPEPIKPSPPPTTKATLPVAAAANEQPNQDTNTSPARGDKSPGPHRSSILVHHQNNSMVESHEVLQRRLEEVWLRLGMPYHLKLNMLEKYASHDGAGALHTAIDLWEAATDMVVLREALVVVRICNQNNRMGTHAQRDLVPEELELYWTQLQACSSMLLPLPSSMPTMQVFGPWVESLVPLVTAKCRQAIEALGAATGDVLTYDGQLNALCDGLINELNAEAKNFDKDPNISAIIVTGSDKAFAGLILTTRRPRWAAGADIKEMATREFIEVYNTTMFANWGDIAKIQKPVIAAVNGFALGGGCELAMLCDMIIAGDTAKFGQPEIKLGTIPGCGGTQRLIRAIGKSKAMHLILTGDLIDAHQAERDGLVAKVVPAANLLDEALAVANKIATYSQPITRMAKEAVNASYEMSLQESVKYEARLFYGSFATHDQKEGMAAFVEKRKPNFKNE
ncbi:hypothetical protein AaE_012943 [Aphanomyces astaci]|uniref:Enoyl-CoA hydratase n=1 Tax=Aphanomyces astaci TaxID=112090 RepID=A0A6A4ZNL7_APHAT|nr:hypothetical protein AaE_012943 [Aphanomyces astaci]